MAVPGATAPAGLKVLVVATEAVPFAKEGGVADVVGSLPKELAELGHDVRIFLPRYGVIDPERWQLLDTGVAVTVLMAGAAEPVRVLQATLPGSSVVVYFLEHEGLFGRHQRIYLGLDQREEQRRFLLFCRGLLAAVPELGFVPDILHLNDWQTAPCAAMVRAGGRRPLRPGQGRIVYTVHNLQYQGRWDPSILQEAGLDPGSVFNPMGLEFWGDVNWMKAGIVYADAVTTASRRHAEEIQTMDFGWGLDEVLSHRRSRLFGIPNGIDWQEWNPETDGRLVARYTADKAIDGKAQNRAAVREAFGLSSDPRVPLVGVVSRLVDQKGFDLVAELAPVLGDLPLQLVVLGSGQAEYERLFQDLAAATTNVRVRIGFDDELARRIYASSDFFLMPSAFEPGGLGQLIALRYGALPIVHATGGLADTVTDLDADPSAGNGISFTPYTAPSLLDALQRALRWYEDRAQWPELVKRAMGYDSRWSASALAYSDLYRRILRVPQE